MKPITVIAAALMLSVASSPALAAKRKVTEKHLAQKHSQTLIAF